jgi:hypothetical protein
VVLLVATDATETDAGGFTNENEEHSVASKAMVKDNRNSGLSMIAFMLKLSFALAF